jgi:3-hydroxyisobutyrate dehydrogenase/2-hydroxy-3-oxopropionate reductase
MEVGFIGLGKMGKPMVRRLLAAGHTVHVHNRSPEAVTELVAEGAKNAGSATGVAKSSEVILTALPTPDTVDEVYNELGAAARAAQIYADHSTVSPGQNRRCADLLAKKGAHFLDAPVSGGPGGAAAGTLTVMVGGDQATFDRALPVFQSFGKNIRLCGPVGAGQAVKLVNQLLVGIHTAASAEAVVFGVSLGADPQVLLDVLGSSFGSSQMLLRNLPRFISRDFNAATPVGLILKDLRLIEGEAERTHVPLQLGALAERIFAEASSRGMTNEDMAGLVRLVEQAAGIEVGHKPTVVAS